LQLLAVDDEPAAIGPLRYGTAQGLAELVQQLAEWVLLLWLLLLWLLLLLLLVAPVPKPVAWSCSEVKTSEVKTTTTLRFSMAESQPQDEHQSSG